MLKSSLISGIVLLALSATIACQKNTASKESANNESTSKESTEKSSASNSDESAPPDDQSIPPYAKGREKEVWPIVRGRSVGTIFFGATIPTVERHMKEPCEEKTAERCSYVRRGVRFIFEEEKLTQIEIHRAGRNTGEKDRWGMFRIMFPEKTELGVKRSIVHQEIGKPDRSEDLKPSLKNPAKFRDFYGDDLVLEYDVSQLGTITLAMVQMRKASAPTPAQAPTPVQAPAEPK